MRLAALLVGLALAGAASAAEAPRIDLVVSGRVSEIDPAPRSEWPKDIDPAMLRSHHHVYVLNITVENTLGGSAPGTAMRVYTDYQNGFPTPGRPAVFWLRQDGEGRWRLICAQDALRPSLADPGTRALRGDWRNTADCAPPAAWTYEPGG